jgi:hypothetical protein
MPYPAEAILRDLAQQAEPTTITWPPEWPPVLSEVFEKSWAVLDLNQ